MQPIIRTPEGHVRFKKNAIVSDVLDAASEGRKMDLNDIAAGNYSQEDRCQFAQLIGYSLNGYHELSYVSDEHAREASVAAQDAFGPCEDGYGCRDLGCRIHCGVERET